MTLGIVMPRGSRLMLSVRRLLALGVAFLASKAATTFALEGEWRESDKIIAYAVSVTRDGPYMDGAAVLAHAIRTAARRSKYGFELVAIVHPTVQTSREPLQKAGWKLIERDTPVNVSAIRGDFLREHIEENGCCGAAELLKLYAWTLTEYHRIVHLDMDSLVLETMDELYDLDKDMIYTCDYGTVVDASVTCPVQGGFFVVRPSRELYNDMIDVVLEGDFVEWGGWGDTGIGWFWGGMTIQGLLPYYFEHLRHGELSLQVDECVYNNMFDSDRCRGVSRPYIKNIHFTICDKPWSCTWHQPGSACEHFTDVWFDIRHQAEIDATGAALDQGNCQKSWYTPMSYLNNAVVVP